MSGVVPLSTRRTVQDELDALGRIIEQGRKIPASIPRIKDKAAIAEKAVVQALIIIRRQQDDIALISSQVAMIEDELRGRRC